MGGEEGGELSTPAARARGMGVGWGCVGAVGGGGLRGWWLVVVEAKLRSGVTRKNASLADCGSVAWSSVLDGGTGSGTRSSSTHKFTMLSLDKRSVSL